MEVSDDEGMAVISSLLWKKPLVPPTTREYRMCILHDVELVSIPQGMIERLEHNS